MKKFQITVYDDFFDKSFSGEFVAENEDQARNEAKEFYAQELDTDPHEIAITSCVLITQN